jgi:hypothetical protein
MLSLLIHLLIGTTTNVGALTVIKSGLSEGNTVLYFDAGLGGDFGVFAMSSGGGSGAATGLRMGKNSSTLRSINAGGTINASGADYAEYMTKADNFTINKGDVCGIDVNGKLTNVFANAVSFVVKSTNPSYVGGDTWGTEEALNLFAPTIPKRTDETDEEWETKETKYETDLATYKTQLTPLLENARQKVDRIAFSGQVPVNVTNATVGQYIIPVNDNGSIKGQAISNPTFEQYMSSIGKVIAIESDGRAKIIVKVS